MHLWLTDVFTRRGVLAFATSPAFSKPFLRTARTTIMGLCVQFLEPSSAQDLILKDLKFILVGACMPTADAEDGPCRLLELAQYQHLQDQPPPNAKIICMCAAMVRLDLSLVPESRLRVLRVLGGTVRDSSLELRVTVKAYDKVRTVNA